MSRSSGSIRLVVAFIVQLALIFSVWASNIGTNPTNPCENPCDSGCSVQQSAMGSDVGVDGVGGAGLVGAGGCSSGGCGSGGGQPQFTAGIGINGAGFAGFNLPLGPAQRPGGMEGGKLVFQIKTLEAGGLPMSALQYSLAPAKPVMLASGKVIRSDLWNKRHDYLPSANFMMKAV